VRVVGHVTKHGRLPVNGSPAEHEKGHKILYTTARTAGFVLDRKQVIRELGPASPYIGEHQRGLHDRHTRPTHSQYKAFEITVCIAHRDLHPRGALKIMQPGYRTT
jgi:hypothetical protein